MATDEEKFARKLFQLQDDGFEIKFSKSGAVEVEGCYIFDLKALTYFGAGLRAGVDKIKKEQGE